MTPYISRFVSEENRLVFARVQHIVSALPDINLRKDRHGVEILLSCHMIARAIGRTINLPWDDGFFAKAFAHSWLYTPDREWIIDCYPVGAIGGPLLIDLTASDRTVSPGRLYAPARRFAKNIPFRSPEFRRSVRRIERAIRCLAAA